MAASSRGKDPNKTPNESQVHLAHINDARIYLLQTFVKIDTQRDGKLTLDELLSAGLPLKQGDSVHAELKSFGDRDRDYRISVEETLTQLYTQLSRGEVLQLVNEYDEQTLQKNVDITNALMNKLNAAQWADDSSSSSSSTNNESKHTT
jgi:hypothetical protein